MTEVPPPLSGAGPGDDEIKDEEIIDAELVAEPSAAASVPPPAALAPAAGWAESAVAGLDYTDAGVPTLDYVRNRVEGRLGTAAGAAELAEVAADRGREQRLADQQAEREAAAADRLAAIRASLRPAD